MLRWGGVMLVLIRGFRFQWLGFHSREGTSCFIGHRVFVLLEHSDVDFHWDMVSHAAHQTTHLPFFASAVRCRVTRATGEHLVVKIGGNPYRSVSA